MQYKILTGSRRRSSVSRRVVLVFSCMSSLHSLSEAGGDSARSGKSSLVLGPRKRILSRRFSMVNTAHPGFTLTWRTATLQDTEHRSFYWFWFYIFSAIFLKVTKYENEHRALYKISQNWARHEQIYQYSWHFIFNANQNLYYEHRKLPFLSTPISPIVNMILHKQSSKSKFQHR